jgi:hypothetical protein
MNTREALLVWDKVFPFAAKKEIYPQAWVLRMWCGKYSVAELEYAVLTARRAASTGRIKRLTIDEVSKYVSGVLRRRRNQDEEVRNLIKAHIAEKVQSTESSDAK